MVNEESFRKDVEELKERYKRVIMAIEVICHTAFTGLNSLRSDIDTIIDAPYRGKSAAEAAALVLHRHGKPMHLTKIAEEFVKGGYEESDPETIYFRLSASLPGARNHN